MVKRTLFLLSILVAEATLARYPSFEQSLGKGDRYFNQYYTQFMQRLSKLSSHDFIYRTFYLCSKLYRNNYPAPYPLKKTPKIPSIIHQIWLGSPFPEKYRVFQRTWKSIPGWEYKLWTDKDIEALKLVNKDLYDACKNYGQRSDIARMEILNRFGGIYVDVDFECINAQPLFLLNRAYDFYAGIEPLDLQRFTFSINNALIASIPGHPILKAYIKELRQRWHTGSPHETIFKTGPVFLTSLFTKYAHRGYKDIALPPSYLYPLGAHQINLSARPPMFIVKARVRKPETIAIHWWAGSWKEPMGAVRQVNQEGEQECAHTNGNEQSVYDIP